MDSARLTERRARSPTQQLRNVHMLRRNDGTRPARRHFSRKHNNVSGAMLPPSPSRGRQATRIPPSPVSAPLKHSHSAPSIVQRRRTASRRSRRRGRPRARRTILPPTPTRPSTAAAAGDSAPASTPLSWSATVIQRAKQYVSRPSTRQTTFTDASLGLPNVAAATSADSADEDARPVFAVDALTPRKAVVIASLSAPPPPQQTFSPARRQFVQRTSQFTSYDADPYSGNLNPTYVPKPKGILNPFTGRYIQPQTAPTPLKNANGTSSKGPKQATAKPLMKRQRSEHFFSIQNSSAAHLFGQAARQRFFKQYKAMTLVHHHVVDANAPSAAPLIRAGHDHIWAGGSDSEDELSTERGLPTEPGARKAFLENVCAAGVPPEPTIVRKRWTPHLNLAHYGLGERLGVPLASSLKDLPHLEFLDLRDNRMTDDMLSKTIAALRKRSDEAAHRPVGRSETPFAAKRKAAAEQATLVRHGRRRRASVARAMRHTRRRSSVALGGAAGPGIQDNLQQLNAALLGEQPGTQATTRQRSRKGSRSVSRGSSRPGSSRRRRRQSTAQAMGPLIHYEPVTSSTHSPSPRDARRHSSRRGSSTDSRSDSAPRRMSGRARRGGSSTAAAAVTPAELPEREVDPRMNAHKLAKDAERVLTRGVTVHDMGTGGIKMRSGTASRGDAAHAAHTGAGLFLLNVSQNTIGPQSAVALVHWLPRATRLHTLSLRRTQLLDTTATPVLDALQQVPTLTSLDVSDNKLAVASAAVLAKLVATLPALRHLDVAWNNLAVDGGCLLAQAVGKSSSLRTLNVSWNRFSKEACQLLGHSLNGHEAMEDVDVSHNFVDAASCMVLAGCIAYCPTLRTMKLDGNPIGRSGARALLRGLSKRGTAYTRSLESGVPADMPLWMVPLHRTVAVSIVGCDIQSEEISLFDPQEPGGEYALDLEHPYDRHVFRQLLMRAEERPGFQFCDMEYVDPDDGRTTTLSMHREPVGEEEPNPWPPGVQDSEGRCVVMSQGIAWDVPQQGVIRCTVKFERQPPSRAHIATTHGFGNVMELVQSPELNAKSRLQLVHVISDDADLSCRQAKTVLNVRIVQQLDQTTRVGQLARLLCRVVDHENVSALIDSCLRPSGRRLLSKLLGNMFMLVARNPTGRYRFDLDLPGDRAAALRLVEINCQEKRARIKLLGGAHAVGDTSQNGMWDNIRNVTHNGVSMIGQDGFTERVPRTGVLEMDYVSTTRPPPGARPVDEHDLRHLMQRLKLLPRQVTRILDFRKGRRNEGVEHLVFKRLRKCNRALRFLQRRNLIVALFGEEVARQMMPQVKQGALKRLRLWKGRARKRLVAKAVTAPPMVRTQSHYMKRFMGEAPLEEAKAADAAEAQRRKRSNVRTPATLTRPVSDATTPVASRSTSTAEMDAQALAAKLASFADAADSDDAAASAHVRDRQKKQQRGLARRVGGRSSRKGSDSSTDGADVALEELDDYSGTDSDDSDWEGFFDGPDQGTLTARQRRAELEARRVRCNESLQDLHVAVTGYYLRAKQVAAVVRLYPPATAVPGARVTAVCSMFSRIIDLDNFDIVLEELTPSEATQVEDRLGILNIVNPIKAERAYTLNLSLRDHREMCAVLVRLAVVEPGENWCDEDFDGIIGWKLPNTWATSVPLSGMLKMRYTSAAPGCAPVWQERLSLLPYVLCNKPR